MNVVLLWLINEKGEILLAQRAAHMRTDASMWGPSVSGKIDSGETAEQAAIREAGEELGIKPQQITPLHYLRTATHNHSDGEVRNFSAYCAYVSSTIDNLIKLEPKEVAAIQWISLTDLRTQYQLHPETIIISSDAALWKDEFLYLEAAIAGAKQP